MFHVWVVSKEYVEEWQQTISPSFHTDLDSESRRRSYQVGLLHEATLRRHRRRICTNTLALFQRTSSSTTDNSLHIFLVSEPWESTVTVLPSREINHGASQFSYCIYLWEFFGLPGKRTSDLCLSLILSIVYQLVKFGQFLL